MKDNKDFLADLGLGPINFTKQVDTRPDAQIIEYRIPQDSMMESEYYALQTHLENLMHTYGLEALTNSFQCIKSAYGDTK